VKSLGGGDYWKAGEGTVLLGMKGIWSDERGSGRMARAREGVVIEDLFDGTGAITLDRGSRGVVGLSDMPLDEVIGCEGVDSRSLVEDAGRCPTFDAPVSSLEEIGAFSLDFGVDGTGVLRVRSRTPDF